MATIDVRDAAGNTVGIEKPLTPGRSVAAASRPVALSTEDKASLDGVISALSGVASLHADVGTTLHGDLATLNGKDFATQTTLAAVLAKLSADPATQTTLAAVLAKLTSDPATQTTLSLVLAACQAATPAGTNIIGKVGFDLTTPGTTNAVVSSPIAIATATHTNVVGAAADTVLLAANASRKPGSTIANDSTAILYIKLAANGSSATSYWVAVDGKTTVAGVALIPDGYVGAVCGTWASATGSARVVEMA